MNPDYVLRNGTIVTSDGRFPADLLIRSGRIKKIDSGLKPRHRQVEIDCSDHFIYPGLINAHDHLEFNLFPRLGEPPYQNAYEWGNDLQQRWSQTIQAIQKIPLRYRLLWGAWKNLFSGVTRVVHHNPYYIHLRFQFPVEVLKRYCFAHSLRFDSDLQAALRRRKRNAPFLIHLAEGTDNLSSREVSELKNLGGLDERTVAVHALGITESDIELLHHSRASVIWCPSSNLFLFNKTAPIDGLANKIPLCLGTDSTLTGSETLFDELRIARKESSLKPQQLFHLVTDAARKIFRFSSDAGTITEGGRADLFLLPSDGVDPYERLLRASPLDIALLVRNGKIVFFDSALIHRKDSLYKGFILQMNGHTKIIRDKSFDKIFSQLRPYLSHYSYLKSSTDRAHTARMSTQEIPFRCPSCKKTLERSKNRWKCAHESYIFSTANSIPDFVLPSRRARVNKFLNVYKQVRQHERWGCENIQYYFDLPHSDISGEHSKVWKIRAKTFDCLMKDESFRQSSAQTTVLDLGAGNCWFPLKLAQHGYHVIAVDINTDPLDGLGVYTRMQKEGAPKVQCIRAEFDFLPFSEKFFDHIVFNASLHYSENPNATLLKTLLLLKGKSTLWILDSPIYHKEESGKEMVKERVREFKEKFNLSVAEELAGKYLIFSELEKLRTSYKVEFRIPDYGFSWKLRSLLSFLLRRRKPASFVVVKIQKMTETVR